jgi:hypothetical protein
LFEVALVEAEAEAGTGAGTELALAEIVLEVVAEMFSCLF